MGSVLSYYRENAKYLSYVGLSKSEVTESPPMFDRFLSIEGIGVVFDGRRGPACVLQEVSLKVQQGEFISIIGHSGCGKSTLLNVVAGLVPARTGAVVLENREVNSPGPDRAMVFQSHALMPWMTVYQNVKLAVDRVFGKSKSRQERAEWTRHNLELVHMDHALDKYPHELSGGMRQRVGIARALSMEPKVLLMDEPFGALDALTRAHMQDTLIELQSRLNNTVLMVTHDVDEAVLLSDRIVMMSNGPAATVGAVMSVDLLRPRDRVELADSAAYNRCRAEVLKFLYQRHVRPEPKARAAPKTAVAQRGAGKAPEWKGALTIGFVPLTDCAPLVIAREKGYFRNRGLDVTLARQSSWDNIRDKVSTGLLDGAQMLAGLPLAASLGTQPGVKAMITALSLGLNGNAITVSEELYLRMQGVDPEPMSEPRASARALKRVIDLERRAGHPPLAFGIVHPVSSHNYLLRYWMAAAGIDPDREVRLVVVPPPQMPNHLRARNIAGFCVGEPWNGHVVQEGLGRTLITSYEIWNNHPEKVYGVTAEWAERHPESHQAVLMALIEASRWLDEPENRLEAAEIIAAEPYLDVALEVVEGPLAGRFQYARDRVPRPLADFHVFYRYAANFPWRSHAAWFLSQMVRWNPIAPTLNFKNTAEAVYRPDLYREAAKALGVPYPTCDYKAEGTHLGRWTLADASGAIAMGADGFFDGLAFEADRVAEYLEGLPAPVLEPLPMPMAGGI